MPSPHYPDVRISTRDLPSTEALISRVLSQMRRHGVPRAERMTFAEAFANKPLDEALRLASEWVTIITPEMLPHFDLSKVRLRSGIERASLVLNPSTRFKGFGHIPTLHTRDCSTVESTRTKAYNASARTAFASERMRREAGEWPSLAFCRRCVVEKVR